MEAQRAAASADPGGFEAQVAAAKGLKAQTLVDFWARLKEARQKSEEQAQTAENRSPKLPQQRTLKRRPSLISVPGLRNESPTVAYSVDPGYHEPQVATTN